MPRFADVIGQQMAVSVLKRSIRTGAVAHAYLFTGPSGVGKMTTALAFASALNCTDTREEIDGCGECWSCRSINGLQHPDLTILSPMGAGDETRIMQTKDMIRTSSFAPVKGQRKIVIVERAETLNEESSSSILKILEEPPDYFMIILLTANPAVLLDTIRSRCQRVRLIPAALEVLQSQLSHRYGLPDADAAFLASYAEGRPGVAISLVGNTAFFAKRDGLAQLAGAAAGAESRWGFLRLAERLRQLAEGDEETTAAQTRKCILAAFDTLILWYRDLLMIKLRGSDASVINSDRREELIRQVSLYRSPKRFRMSLSALARGKKAVAGNANLQITTEAVMLALTI